MNDNDEAIRRARERYDEASKRFLAADLDRSVNRAKRYSVDNAQYWGAAGFYENARDALAKLLAGAG